MTCNNCGAKLFGKKKFCSKECQYAYHRDHVKEEKPPLFTHCQNPNCGKELNHWVKMRRRNMYVRDRKFCDIACRAAYQSITMQGDKGNLAKTNTKKKYIPINFGVDKSLRDPLAFDDIIVDM